ncbi:CDP-alcohol phosphatidyltransferase family protein [Cellulomonas shaoxiangyii]|uniref:CDP-alcohol phosphatidyltransferase family protein n=1 Tax=Cellulomonas shaoxiangyii TaxID=2566013 RepID=A0A4P7SJY1_9CELL|nr:CDP-alcohol phosphatidyltransferase family protein [Cellulomonas shaoxiangyii]QCB94440.1 CDP-alcohol phosphatidyltransferase family protein [Cellulomonas shaoxiangyii]TGY85155.1 CDP-alcohol phosphatidyltransferase family protein [Cellulomonas shaoxiangyii]
MTGTTTDRSAPVGRETFRQTLDRLGAAQKGAARSAPAYSRFVNRRLGRVLAAWAYRRGLTPNAVTGVSALCTFSAVALLALVPPSWGTAVGVCLLLVLGYAFDSADGQVARLTGTGSSAGEWLDHMVDATKVVALPLALAVGLYRFEAVDVPWLLVPLANAVVGSVLFFGMMLTEQLRRAHGVVSRAPTGGRLPWLRPVLVLPTDYGVLCLAFLLYGLPQVFVPVLGVLTLGTAGFLALALPKWFRDVRSLGRGSAP